MKIPRSRDLKVGPDFAQPSSLRIRRKGFTVGSRRSRTVPERPPIFPGRFCFCADDLGDRARSPCLSAIERSILLRRGHLLLVYSSPVAVPSPSPVSPPGLRTRMDGEGIEPASGGHGEPQAGGAIRAEVAERASLEGDLMAERIALHPRPAQRLARGVERLHLEGPHPVDRQAPALELERTGGEGPAADGDETIRPQTRPEDPAPAHAIRPGMVLSPR